MPRRSMNRLRPADAPVFREIVARVSAQDAARMYGVQIDRHGMACCPLHAERTPSCKFYFGTGGFYCFGCGVGGDVVTLVEKMFGLSALDAAKKLSADFSLGLFEDACPQMQRQKPAEPPENAAQRELDRLRRMTPHADPAAWGAAQGRIEYLEYMIEEARVRKLLQNIQKTTT